MKQPFFSIQKLACLLLMMTVCGALMTSCDNILDNGYGDCEVEYRVKFKYDYNMKYADAFPHEVRSVTLYAFGKDGKLVYQKTEEGEILAQKDYTMLLELEEGDYDFITWAGLEGQESFAVPMLTPGVSTMEELTCRMNRIANSRSSESEDSVGYLLPLWHGKEAFRLSQMGESRATLENTHVFGMPLVKNTNTFRIILQQLSEEPIDVNSFEFRIDDCNGFMAHDNSILEDTPLVYYPYHYATGSTEAGAEGDENLNLAVAELSTGRLMADAETPLTITNKETGEVVFSIPLIKYLSVYKTVANYDMPLQEFLDREDEYVLHFFLDERGEWLKTQVIINDWIVRYNDITAEF